VLIYYLIPLLTKAIPSALAALIIGALTAYFLGWDVPIIGEIPSEQIYRLESYSALYHQKHTP
jgi:MFS superfamily sulfate permease-like transporter